MTPIHRTTNSSLYLSLCIYTFSPTYICVSSVAFNMVVTVSSNALDQLVPAHVNTRYKINQSNKLQIHTHIIASPNRCLSSLSHESEMHATSIVIHVTTNIKSSYQNAVDNQGHGSTCHSTEEVFILIMFVLCQSE